ncbi:hypothetical protein QBC47DRAFT_404397 [Echria macrotheca]|uniref:Rhodopsin n=1 Tax=Echria macrotheca TaxID=438768 RepID=A0AAJ0BA87_9PEZI|nr:hypothetical protein QBC47DRAFT_404397 [Echria macrotheca]
MSQPYPPQQGGYYPPPGPQGYPPPQGYAPQGYPPQGYPPPTQQMNYQPQPQKEEKSHGCLYSCIAAMCCCWLCGETCECCLECLDCCF